MRHDVVVWWKPSRKERLCCLQRHLQRGLKAVETFVLLSVSLINRASVSWIVRAWCLGKILGCNFFLALEWSS
jgi:hypothetical protein